MAGGQAGGMSDDQLTHLNQWLEERGGFDTYYEEQLRLAKEDEKKKKDKKEKKEKSKKKPLPKIDEEEGDWKQYPSFVDTVTKQVVENVGEAVKMAEDVADRTTKTIADTAASAVDAVAAQVSEVEGDATNTIKTAQTYVEQGVTYALDAIKSAVEDATQETLKTLKVEKRQPAKPKVAPKELVKPSVKSVKPKVKTQQPKESVDKCYVINGPLPEDTTMVPCVYVHLTYNQ